MLQPLGDRGLRLNLVWIKRDLRTQDHKAAVWKALVHRRVRFHEVCIVTHGSDVPMK